MVNQLIREALHPYTPDLVLVSKVGAARGPRGEIFAADQPEQLRDGIEDNLRTLDVESIPVVDLRIMRASLPDALFDDQLQAMVAARDDGLIGEIGLSNVSLAQLQHALRFVEVVCVQNSFSPLDRASEPVLEECHRRGIAFVPFVQFGFGSASVLAHPTLVQIASRLACTPAQACLAWELAFAPNILLIPGTTSQQHTSGRTSRRRAWNWATMHFKRSRGCKTTSSRGPARLADQRYRDNDLEFGLWLGLKVANFSQSVSVPLSIGVHAQVDR